MKKALSLSFASVVLLLVSVTVVKAQSEYGYCNYDSYYPGYKCEGKSIYTNQYDNFAYYTTIASGQLPYSVQIWIYGSPYQGSGYASILGPNGSVSFNTYNTNWVFEQGTLHVGANPTWIEGEFGVYGGELTMTVGW